LLRPSFHSCSIGRSRRNTPALFGAGLIDAIPDSVLEAAERRRYPVFPAIGGRLSRLSDGRIGRFGWKAQTASLRDFVLTACSVELGLEVPEHHQSDDPSEARQHPAKKTAAAAPLDLIADECDALVAYVASLPQPVATNPRSPGEEIDVLKGGAAFKQVGCAACHTPKLGDVEGLYSDLLLHDM